MKSARLLERAVDQRLVNAVIFDVEKSDVLAGVPQFLCKWLDGVRLAAQVRAQVKAGDLPGCAVTLGLRH
jgi:hypothetical protein